MKEQKNNKFILKTLSNGIKVYFYKDKKLKRTFVSYNVNYGSHGYFNKFYYDNKLYETPFGIAHFIEHTLIEHSKRGSMLHVFLDKNYETNGYTRSENTTYYFLGIKDIKESIKELIEMVDCPVFTKEDIEEVKHAVIEEVKTSMDDKYNLAFNLSKRNTYSNYEVVSQSLSHLGTPKDTESYTYDLIKLCYDAYYNDENKSLLIAGNIDIKKMISYLESIYSNIERHPNKLKPFDYDSTFKVRKVKDYVYRNSNTNFSIITFKNTYDCKNKYEKLKMSIYLSIFWSMTLSYKTDFTTRLNEVGIVVGGIRSYDDFFNGILELKIYADVTDEEKFFNELIKELHNKELSKREFELYKKNFIAMDLERKDYVIDELINFPNLIEFTDSVGDIDTLKELNFEEFKNTINKINFDTYTRVVITNKK